MRLRLVSISVLLGLLLSSCTVADPAGMLWKVSVGGEAIFPGNQAIYVKKINKSIENWGGLRSVNIKNGEISWELKIVSDKGQLTFVEAEKEKYTLQMDIYPGDKMVEANLKTNVEGYDEQAGVVFVKTDEQRLDSMDNFQRLYSIRLKDGQILWKVGLDALKTRDLGFIIGSLFNQDGLVGFISLEYNAYGTMGNSTIVDTNATLNMYDVVTGKIWSQNLVSKGDFFKPSNLAFTTILRDGNKIYLSRGYPRMWDLRTGEGVDMQTPASVAVVDGNYPQSIVVKDTIAYSTRFNPKSSVFKGDFFIICMNVDTGKVLWQYKLYKENTTLATKGPLVTDASVFASQGDTLYEFDKTTGSLINKTRLSGQIDDIDIEQNLLYLLSTGTLYALDLNTTRGK